MWQLGFFFHEMGFGLLSIFLPLYIITIGGSLIDIGVLSAVALLVAIPASFFWGYMCDRTRRYKLYILVSFLSSTILLYTLSLTRSINVLILLYVVLSFLHVAHEPPKNVLIAELYSRADWEKSFAFYESFTEVGWLVGLVLGFITSFSGGYSEFSLLLCSVLNLIAFGTSLFLVTDPSLIFERSLVNLEKSVDFAHRGVLLASRIFDGASVTGKLRRENVNALCVGLILFSLATSILFTPMPIFVSSAVNAAGLSSSFVFMLFILNSCGGICGYVFAGRRSTNQAQRTDLTRVVVFRGFLSFLLLSVFFSMVAVYNVGIIATILVLMGFAYALFIVYTLSLSMELIPSGKSGLFNVLIGIGGAIGSFVGPLIAAQTVSFAYVFITAGIIFFAAYSAFRVL